MNTFYEFFAGGGMARAGLGDDWSCIFANDISEKKAAAYKENWGDGHLVVGDIFSLKTKDLQGHADLAWGSFPCQDLSLAGNGQGLVGERSGAFWGFWKLIEKLANENRKPKMIVLENVLGTLTSHEGKDFELIAKAVVREGYVFGAVVIDAVHFTAQSRPRVFIVGIDSSWCIPSETHHTQATPAWHPESVIRAYNRLPKIVKNSWRWWNLPAPATRMETLESIIEKNPSDVEWHTYEQTQKLLSMMSDRNRQKVIAVQKKKTLTVGTIYRRTRDGVQRAEVRFDGVAGCLRTPTGGSSRQTIMLVDGSRIHSRLISSREAARLMGLSEDYKLPKRYNDAYHLLGDGVVVPVVSHLREYVLMPLIKANKQKVTVSYLGQKKRA